MERTPGSGCCHRPRRDLSVRYQSPIWHHRGLIKKFCGLAHIFLATRGKQKSKNVTFLISGEFSDRHVIIRKQWQSEFCLIWNLQVSERLAQLIPSLFSLHTVGNIYRDNEAPGKPMRQPLEKEECVFWHQEPRLQQAKRTGTRSLTHTHTQNLYCYYIPYRSGYLGMSWQARRREFVTRSRASVCLFLLSRQSPQSDTGSNRPARQTHKHREGIGNCWGANTKSNIKFVSDCFPSCYYLLFHKAMCKRSSIKNTYYLRWVLLATVSFLRELWNITLWQKALVSVIKWCNWVVYTLTCHLKSLEFGFKLDLHEEIYSTHCKMLKSCFFGIKNKQKKKPFATNWKSELVFLSLATCGRRVKSKFWTPPKKQHPHVHVHPSTQPKRHTWVKPDPREEK